jgi:hypothetical protein
VAHIPVEGGYEHAQQNVSIGPGGNSWKTRMFKEIKRQRRYRSLACPAGIIYFRTSLRLKGLSIARPLMRASNQ